MIWIRKSSNIYKKTRKYYFVWIAYALSIHKTMRAHRVAVKHTKFHRGKMLKSWTWIWNFQTKKTRDWWARKMKTMRMLFQLVLVECRRLTRQRKLNPFQLRRPFSYSHKQAGFMIFWFLHLISRFSCSLIYFCILAEWIWISMNSECSDNFKLNSLKFSKFPFIKL